MLCRALMLLAVSIVFSSAIHAQPSSGQRTETPRSPADASGQQPEPLGSPVMEMAARNAVRHEEAAHRENIARARESAELGAELRSTFARNRTLSRDDLKKLERMEKLVRRIRSAAGGSSADNSLENPPRDLGAALDRLAEVAGALRKRVESTSRHVVSAAVIEHTNELIELIRHIKTHLR